MFTKSSEKKSNTCKNISPTFKYLNFIFQIATNLGAIQALARIMDANTMGFIHLNVHP
jgi:hypothetical protein